MNRFDNISEEQAREDIHAMVVDFYQQYRQRSYDYTEGDRLHYAARIFDADEMCSLVDSALDFWLTSGRFTERFEKEFADFLGVKFCSLVNSGSSANLLAFMALTATELGERRILRGDEVITVAAGFPTTVAPLIQYGAIPVFVDVTIPSYNIDVEQLHNAFSERTKAVILAHTLGNPFNVTRIKEFCDRHRLWLIEDNCDALGASYCLDGNWKYTGTIGDIGTSSFYPPHHMTMGEGGAVYTNNALLHQLINSFRDWGRDCKCPTGVDNLCRSRFDRQDGMLPSGYDHKYVYSHFGYNLKATDMQAAIGCEQLRKLSGFIARRQHNWQRLRDGLAEFEEHLTLPMPEVNASPSWFGFLMTVNDGVERDSIVRHLEDHGIQTRMLFAGNLIKHPCFDEMRLRGDGFRVIGDLFNTDRIMRDTFWIGVYPGLTDEMIDYVVKVIKDFFA